MTSEHHTQDRAQVLNDLQDETPLDGISDRFPIPVGLLQPFLRTHGARPESFRLFEEDRV